MKKSIKHLSNNRGRRLRKNKRSPSIQTNEVETLHVHFGRKHAERKQCGLCDKNFKSYKMLDDHKSQSEALMCSNRGCRNTFENLTDVKEHINTEHRQNSPAHYQFSYWIIHTKDKSERQINKTNHTIYPKNW